MALKLSNQATSALATNINATATTITIRSGDEAKFPALSTGDWFPLVIVDNNNNMEIVHCTARAGVTMTVVRGQEGTARRSFSADARVDLRMTAAAFLALVDLTQAFGILPNDALAGDYSFGSLLLSGNNATGLVVERPGSAVNINMEFRGPTTSLFIGQRNGQLVAGTSGDLSQAANRIFSASLQNFALDTNLTVSGSIDAGQSEVRGSLTHAGAYMGFNSFSTSTYGVGDARAWYDANNRRVNFSPTGAGSGRVSINADIEGSATSAGSATTAGTATNCLRQVVAGDGLSGGGVMNANRPLSVDGSVARVFTGSSAGTTDFPVGTELIVRLDSGNMPARNAAVRFGTDSDGSTYLNSGSNIVGTWRQRGGSHGFSGTGFYKAQRTL